MTMGHPARRENPYESPARRIRKLLDRFWRERGLRVNIRETLRKIGAFLALRGEMSEQIWHECGLCGGRFQYGPHRYEGHFITRYKLVACDRCWHGNADGWGPAAELKVLAHLKRNWIAVPERNEKGLL
ncbi:MAG TPA: hypothetical protein VK739_01195, partial [bacterium]|nr:hypothetical protein [bacterium]